jgi:hypothetical protein
MLPSALWQMPAPPLMLPARKLLRTRRLPSGLWRTLAPPTTQPACKPRCTRKHRMLTGLR